MCYVIHGEQGWYHVSYADYADYDVPKQGMFLF